MWMKSLFRCTSWFPRLLAGEGVQGAALVLPRTPAARLACFDIKIQISGGCLNGATQERSEFRRTSRLQGSPFLSPISFGDAKEMGSAVGPKPDLLPQTKHTAQTRSSNGPHPRLPPAGEGVNAALTPALSRKRERELCSALSAAWGKLLPCFNARAQYPESPPSSPWCTGAADHPARPAHRPLPPAGRAA